MYSIQVSNFAQWHRAVSSLLAAKIPPHELDWRDETSYTGLLDAPSLTPDTSTPLIELAPSIYERLEEACGYRGADRWSLPYRVLWRWQHGEKTALLPGDPDGMQLARRMRAVCGAGHAMKGFLRFHERAPGLADPRFVAWYEPTHDVLKPVAQHFAERMGRSTWLIATPLGCANWDGQRLAFGPAIAKPTLETDAVEVLWLEYYRNTFNPERLNVDLMQSHLPRMHWQNLPETKLIHQLVSEASLGHQRQKPTAIPSAHAIAAVITERPSCEPGQSPRASLGEALEACRRCELWQHATYPVGGSGPSNAELVIVGEQADDHDDLIGEPFSGEIGRFLEALLNEAGLSRDEVYVTQAVKHFRFETRQLQRLYRSPAPEHIAACRFWLEHELEMLPARIIVALGRSAASALGLPASVIQREEIPVRVELGRRSVFVTRHPSYAAKASDPAARAQARSHIVASLRCAAQALTVLA